MPMLAENRVHGKQQGEYKRIRFRDLEFTQKLKKEKDREQVK